MQPWEKEHQSSMILDVERRTDTPVVAFVFHRPKDTEWPQVMPLTVLAHWKVLGVGSRPKQISICFGFVTGVGIIMNLIAKRFPCKKYATLLIFEEKLADELIVTLSEQSDET